MSSQISFKEFKDTLLEPGLVDRIAVSNKSVARVYVNSLPPNPGEPKADPAQGSAGDGSDTRTASRRHKFYFNIGSIELFEKKLDEAQQALGIDPHNYVPVIYEVNEPPNEILGFILMLWVVAGVILMKGSSGVGASIMKGGQGLFSFGKAKITKLDKNSKNKVSIV